jgi:hypothetical protein
MNLTYSRPNNIPARIPYHFHVEANKRFVRCHTWVQSMHNKMDSYNAKFNQNRNSCCIPEFRFPGRSFHIKLFHLQMCFTKLRMRDDTNLLNSHSTKLNPQPCGAISSTTCKLILLLVWNQGGNKRSNSFKLRTHFPDWGLSSPAHCSSHSSNFALTRAPMSNNSQKISKEEQNYPRD